MTAGRGHLTRLRGNLETFGRGAELLSSSDTARAGLAILDELVKYDETFRDRIFDTLEGFVRNGGCAEGNEKIAKDDDEDDDEDDNTIKDWDRPQPTILRDAIALINKINKATADGYPRQIDLRGGDLRDMDLVEVDLRGADLRLAKLQYADLLLANLQGANLRAARLIGANLNGANLQGADLLDANLQDAHFSHAHLQGSRWHGTKLTGSELLASTAWEMRCSKEDAGILNETLSMLSEEWCTDRKNTNEQASEYPYLFFQDETSEPLWVSGKPSIKGSIPMVSIVDLPPHW